MSQNILVSKELPRRYRQARDLLRSEGMSGILDRARAALVARLAPKHSLLPVDRLDIIRADLSNPFCPAVPEIKEGEPLTLNWVMIPGAANAGGYTTFFRIIRYLERKGYRNRIYFYNVFRADHRYYESIVRDSYRFDGPVLSMHGPMADAHGIVATSWQTAYPVFNSRSLGRRFYFVQDFEPSFYPTGAVSLLAENTYRMGFYGITAGSWLAQKLSSEYGMRTDSFEFGADHSTYRHLENTSRRGIVFYARPEAARRGFELGLLALELFAKKCPDIEIHLYGDSIGGLNFKCINHGRVSPQKLNEIYNISYTGLSLSLTNVSLVPHEMLAAGCIPVVNDAEHNRLVLNNPFVYYAAANPHALASALEDVARQRDFESLSRAAVASICSSTWDDAGSKVDRIFRSTVSGIDCARTCTNISGAG